MKWEVNQLHRDIEFMLELFNTHGTEIAPRSDVICEYSQF